MKKKSTQQTVINVVSEVLGNTVMPQYKNFARAFLKAYQTVLYYEVTSQGPPDESTMAEHLTLFLEAHSEFAHIALLDSRQDMMEILKPVFAHAQEHVKQNRHLAKNNAKRHAMAKAKYQGMERRAIELRKENPHVSTDTIRDLLETEFRVKVDTFRKRVKIPPRQETSQYLKRKARLAATTRPSPKKG